MEPSFFDIMLLFLVLAGGVWGLMAGVVKIGGPVALAVALTAFLPLSPEVLGPIQQVEPILQYLLLVVMTLASLMIYGLVVGFIHNAVRFTGLDPLNRLAGLGVGFITGAIMAGGLVWGLEVYGGSPAKALIAGSDLAPVVSEFLQVIIACVSRVLQQRAG